MENDLKSAAGGFDRAEERSGSLGTNFAAAHFS
jgi:hypothetical protein